MTATDVDADSASSPAERPAAGAPKEPAELADRGGDVTVALSPQQLAFLALIAALILAGLRRVVRRRRRRHPAETEG